jgi:hypothetical protein
MLYSRAPSSCRHGANEMPTIRTFDGEQPGDSLAPRVLARGVQERKPAGLEFPRGCLHGVSVGHLEFD